MRFGVVWERDVTMALLQAKFIPSLNFQRRKEEQRKIADENMALLQRILKQKSMFSREEWEKDRALGKVALPLCTFLLAVCDSPWHGCSGVSNEDDPPPPSSRIGPHFDWDHV